MTTQPTATLAMKAPNSISPWVLGQVPDAPVVEKLPVHFWPLQGAAVVQSKQFQGCRKRKPFMLPTPTPIFQFYLSASLWCHWGFFLLPRLGTDLLPQTAKDKVPGASQWGDPSLVPSAKRSLWCDFHAVQEELRAEVQGGGRGRAILRTHQRFGHPKANRKGTWGDRAVRGKTEGFPFPRYKRIQLTNPFYRMPGAALSSN